MQEELPQRQFRNELTVMQEASNAHCSVPFYGYISYYNSDQSLVYSGIISQFMPCGSLHDVLHKHKIVIPKHLAYRILIDISQAMHMLHTHGADQRLLHQDLKPSNVMLDEDLRPKLTDFGASAVTSVTSIHRANPTGPVGENRNDQSLVHTLYYTDPEFLVHGGNRPASSDVYSFAIMMWEILSSRKPFAEFSQSSGERFISAVGNGPNPCRPSLDGIADHYPRNIKGIMETGWHQDRSRRPSFQAIRDTLKNEHDDRESSRHVVNVKDQILSKLGRTKFAEQSSNYTVDFARAVARYPSEQGGAAPIRNPADNVPRPEPVMAEPSADLHFSVEDTERRLTDRECVQLGNNLHYTSGWEMLARGMGIPPQIIDNIKCDFPRTVQRKVEIFRAWQQLNGGSNATVKHLIRVLRREKVAVDVWEFLDPDKSIRNSLAVARN